MKNLLSHKVRKAKRWVLDHSFIRVFQHRFPKLASFIGARFHTKSFIGLPLTLVAVLAFLNIGLLSELTESVMDAEWIVVADKEFTSMLYNIRQPWLSKFFYVITQLGEREAVFILGAVVTAIFVYRRRFVALIAFWLVMGGLGLSVRYGKTFISRARPADVAYYEVVHYSFPSGHATTALALYGLLAYFLYRHYDKNRYQRLCLWLAVILILLVGFSRIYLGVHYLSDVLAGFLLGLLWMLVGVSLVEVMMYRRNKPPLNNKS
ncbi:undecaprenyl-diphosphatase [Pontibacter aydingkolensis]|uniref:Phosphatase PAP2 family protein n=1 Tax=Pontibacter aydingkolensis TaxID=1911536 RepID=A0ABS7CY93_9BACT|nr:phosphatase PAP2 family protein [Pontibacter aydingkolensis]MBW7468824.1 phosphatase PAP2 family protein [Pontibacter aydingkolensis]